MPTTYAHYQFGELCLTKMPNDLKDICLKHRNIYNIAVQGPDLLFYNILSPYVSRYGFHLHELSAQSLFENYKTIFKNNKQDEKLLAYIFGMLSHFVLDSTCHSYVERKSEVSGISHLYIETDWDRHLIQNSGLKIEAINRGESIKLNKDDCQIIAKLYPYNTKIIYQSLFIQKLFLNFLYVKDENSKQRRTGLLKILGLNKYIDLFMDFRACEGCKDSNLRLDKLSDRALKLFPILAKNLWAYLSDKSENLDDYFKHDFSHWPNYQDIKILNYQAELKYKIK